jgi:ligand-binding sensor domain-containing protein/two-component sensor histidine kinase
MGIIGHLIATLVLHFGLATALHAEQLPIKTYTTADGLVSNKISRIARDRRGFLWFCTEDGLSRFDGYTFTNYTTQQGLPVNWVDDFLETRDGVFLVATSAGLCIFDPKGVPLAQDKVARQASIRPMFTVFQPDGGGRGATIKVLYEDRAGHLWCGTRNGLYKIEIASGQIRFQSIDLDIRSDDVEDLRIRSLIEDQDGTLWVAVRRGIYRVFADGNRAPLPNNQALQDKYLMGLAPDGGQIWVATRLGLWGISRPGSQTNIAITQGYATKEGLPCVAVNALFVGQDGRLWVGADCGIFEFLKEENRFRRWLGSDILRDSRVWSFNDDRSGNLWVGTAHGAIQLARNGFITYTETDGLGFRYVRAFSESKDDEIGLYTRLDSQTVFYDRFDGKRFHSQKITPLAFLKAASEQIMVIPLQDHQGEWWWATAEGLYRFAKADRAEELFKARPLVHYTVKDGLPDNFLANIYEDKGGDLWMAIGGKTLIARWERTSGKFHIYSEADGLPAGNYMVTMCEDHAGNLWMGFLRGGIARYTNGHFTFFTAADGAPAGEVIQLFADSRGRVWIASINGGLGKIENPAAEIPQIVTYSSADGLASDTVLAIAEDHANQFYIATSRGLNYVNFDTGNVKRFTVRDGLANDQVETIYRDRKGAFWFGTNTGVSRLLTPASDIASAPPIFINLLKVAGETHSLSEVGETEISGLELAPNQDQLEIGFSSLAFATGDLIQYQYKLEGSNNDWQPLTAHRSVNYASLSPGDYRFLVRAVNSDGLQSPLPATLQFRVLAPLWQRWWFLTLTVMVFGLAVYALIRYRVRQLLELERVRTRIAADLHDDIGANLTRIAILSEVANAQLAQQAQAPETPLSSIANISRESISSMSDIVWAINPKKDSLFDLIGRMRRLAEDLLPSRGIDCDFQAPEGDSKIKLRSETRRDAFLIFKEALNNAVRHSACRRVTIILRQERGRFTFSVSDDGRGFEENESGDGQGLANMRRRAESLGAQLHIASRGNHGTTITLTLSH